MGIAELLRDNREQILALARRHGVSNVRVFGSVARGDAREDSDVDLLVDVELDVDIEFLGLWVDLEELLARPVDLVTERSLRPRMREKVLREAVAL
ncbi:MAG: nucleotidyltransferase family protein [Chloroflexia bacterium]